MTQRCNYENLCPYSDEAECDEYKTDREECPHYSKHLDDELRKVGGKLE